MVLFYVVITQCLNIKKKKKKRGGVLNYHTNMVLIIVIFALWVELHVFSVQRSFPSFSILKTVISGANSKAELNEICDASGLQHFPNDS